MNVGVSLAELVSPWLTLDDAGVNGKVVSSLKIDSRTVGKDDTFIAIHGHSVDGRQFISSAVRQGANLVLSQADDATLHGMIDYIEGVPVIAFWRLNDVLSELAIRLYPLNDLSIIGVTGTNGKTTISQLIAQWLELLQHKTSVMGTTGNGFLNELIAAKNTTGSPIDIAATLFRHRSLGAEFASIEVSSHGLAQGRVKAIPFKAGVFTNLSRDHLDYHGTMEEYALAKKSLFTEHHCDHAIINIDDSVGASWLTSLPSSAISVSLHPSEEADKPSLWANQISYTTEGIDISFDGLWGEGLLTAPLIGEFNASNLLLSMATLLALGFSKQDLINTSHLLQPVLGRMELFTQQGKAKVVVDYAHTPDALDKALSALKVHCDGKLWVIFGCGGDRDTGKRPMMAQIAERLADNVIFSDDNPRTETPELIVQDMLAGLKQPENVQIIHSRFSALEFALSHSSADDIILMAGKGHEDYQVIGLETIHYSDRETAQTLLEAKQ
ncbi:UDP-N-acetylmuramoyl-L-alanyl-D-glutamate--2,6-diaminopimelate ligase [Vibrio sp.]|nr:UDP-N-acetylmuramoyl-L-alanyl-D-glutamate--2,6-diaminopimelate ligase [Vibrio sp.]